MAKMEYKHCFVYNEPLYDIEVNNTYRHQVYSAFREPKVHIDRVLHKYHLNEVTPYYIDQFTQVYKGDKFIAYVSKPYKHHANIRDGYIKDDSYEQICRKGRY